MEKIDVGKAGMKLRNTTKFDLFGEEKNIVEIESFTQTGKIYEVDKKGKTCSCPAFTKSKSKKMCKHLMMVLGVNEKKNEGISQSLLKSALQKAVRRNEPEKAVRIVKAMMENNAVDLLRRLPIVIIEDCIVHPKFYELMMILEKAGKTGGMAITEEDRDLVVQITDDIASSEWRDMKFITKEKYEMDSLPFNLSDIESQLPDEEANIVKAIFRRKFLGGMGGDMEMLERVSKEFANLFMKREMTFEKLGTFFKNSQMKYSEVGKVQVEDVMLESVDFHCSPILRVLAKKQYVIDLIEDTFKGDKMPVYERLMDIMWRMRSGVNFKNDFIEGHPIDWFDDAADGNVGNREKYENVYSKIKVDLDNISKWFIGKSVSL